MKCEKIETVIYLCELPVFWKNITTPIYWMLTQTMSFGQKVTETAEVLGFYRSIMMLFTQFHLQLLLFSSYFTCWSVVLKNTYVVNNPILKQNNSHRFSQQIGSPVWGNPSVISIIWAFLWFRWWHWSLAQVLLFLCIFGSLGPHDWCTSFLLLEIAEIITVELEAVDSRCLNSLSSELPWQTEVTGHKARENICPLVFCPGCWDITHDFFTDDYSW